MLIKIRYPKTVTSSRIDWLHLTKHTGTSWEWALLPSADHPCQGLPYIWSIHTGRYSCAELASPLSADGREREGKTRESRSEKRIFLHQSHYNAPSRETRTMQFFSDHKKQVHTHGHAREIAVDQLSRFWLCFPSDWWISGVWTDQSLSVAMQNQSGFELLLTLNISNHCNNCYSSWIRCQIFFCSNRHANRANGSIQGRRIDPFVSLVCHSVDKCYNSY